MGGNVALLYAGIRSERVRAVINLEGFGLRETYAAQAPGRFAQWLDELRSGATLRDHADAGEVAARLVRNNRRLRPERAASSPALGPAACRRTLGGGGRSGAQGRQSDALSP